MVARESSVSAYISCSGVFHLQITWRHLPRHPPVPAQRGRASVALSMLPLHLPLSMPPVLPNVRSAARNQNSPSCVDRDLLTLDSREKVQLVSLSQYTIHS
jgi:hypothetical protein